VSSGISVILGGNIQLVNEEHPKNTLVPMFVIFVIIDISIEVMLVQLRNMPFPMDIMLL
jgi:hypothetical protein